VKAVILAGGVGSRISEETQLRPKPMIEIGGRPILWHIMKIYSAHRIDEFVILCGYKGEVIKQYFAGYFLNSSDITFDLASNTVETHSSGVENWRVTVIDTGEDTMTGGRLKRAAPFLAGETFCLTYGDCVSDIDIGELVRAHRSLGTLVTLTAIQPPGRFGTLTLDHDHVMTFMEKPRGDGGWVNGGFFVVEPEALDYVEGDGTVWEREPLQNLAHEGKLGAYRHSGYWQNMDTLRDKMVLEQQWASPKPPWKAW
jgi:glucose-1-phosphate cytidylyltransferase